ncbi:hypothetical protein PC116_g29828 [Phytophthora cactorum]|nr:hypothetical protein PC116_g29828 [Phytophthora cactorum]
MLIGAGQQQKSISNLIAGAIFFGVPSRGMDIHDVSRMLGDQPNKDALVSEISAKSDYLSRLEKKFAGASLLRQIKMYWAYETKLTPTITSVNNSHSRSGPGTVLVSPGSATAERCYEDPSSTIQIDENHSDMVKFTCGDYKIRIIANGLANICGIHPVFNPSDLETASTSALTNSGYFHGDDAPCTQSLQLTQERIKYRETVPDPTVWDNKGMNAYPT